MIQAKRMGETVILHLARSSRLFEHRQLPQQGRGVGTPGKIKAELQVTVFQNSGGRLHRTEAHDTSFLA